MAGSARPADRPGEAEVSPDTAPQAHRRPQPPHRRPQGGGRQQGPEGGAPVCPAGGGGGPVRSVCRLPHWGPWGRRNQLRPTGERGRLDRSAAGLGGGGGKSLRRRHPEGHPEGQAQPQQHQQPEVVARCPAQPPAEDPLQQQHHAGEQGPQHCQAQQRLQQRAHVSPPPFSSHRASNMARSSPTSSRFRACRSTRAATIALALPA